MDVHDKITRLDRCIKELIRLKTLKDNKRYYGAGAEITFHVGARTDDSDSRDSEFNIESGNTILLGKIVDDMIETLEDSINIQVESLKHDKAKLDKYLENVL